MKSKETLHYKMYKSGRFWVFAGILATTWQLGTFTASADAQPAATGTPDTQTVVAGTSSDSTSKETPLKQPANSAAPATNDSQAQGNRLIRNLKTIMISWISRKKLIKVLVRHLPRTETNVFNGQVPRKPSQLLSRLSRLNNSLRHQ